MAVVALTPVLLLSVLGLLAVWQGDDIYDALRSGAENGLRLTAKLLPALLPLFAAIYALRSCGFTGRLNTLLSPFLIRLGIPPETGLIMLLRPLSGSGALAIASDLIEQYGPDSLIGRTAAVMIGSSETTFYVISVYFSAAHIKDSRWAIPAAICADLACFLSAGLLCRFFWA